MKSDQTVQCDVLTHCAHLCMLYEWVFCSHPQRRFDSHGWSSCGRPTETQNEGQTNQAKERTDFITGMIIFHTEAWESWTTESSSKANTRNKRYENDVVKEVRGWRHHHKNLRPYLAAGPRSSRYPCVI